MTNETLAGARGADKTSGDTDKPVSLIVGTDEYLVAEKAAGIIGRILPDDKRALGLETIDARGETVDDAVRCLRQCLEALQTFGFFGGEKVVWFRDAEFLAPPKGRSAEAQPPDAPAGGGRSPEVKTLLDALTEVVDRGLLPGQWLVITASRVDARSSFYKTCKKRGVVHEFNTPERADDADQQTSATAMREFARAGVRISGDALEMLVERLGADTRLVVSEVEKLCLHAGSRRKVEVEDVKVMVPAVREAASWDLTDAVCDRDLPKALRSLRQLLFQKEVPIALVGSLEKRMSELVIMRTALDRGWARIQGGYRQEVTWAESEDAERLLGCLGKDDPRTLHWFRVSRLARQANRGSLADFLAAREAVIKAREQMVSTAVPPAVILELLLVRLLAERPRAQGRQYTASASKSTGIKNA